MSNVFVVVECGWEYNDERIYKPESSGGMPVKVYTDEAVAEEACRELTFKELKRLGKSTDRWGGGLASYIPEDGMCGQWGFFTDKGIDLLVEAGVYSSAEAARDDGWGEELVLKNMTDDQIRALAKEIREGNEFYEVVTAEMDEPSPVEAVFGGVVAAIVLYGLVCLGIIGGLAYAIYWGLSIAERAVGG